MDDLVKKLREECTGLFAEHSDRFKANFGVDEEFQSSKHLWLCAPDVNYSRFSLGYVLLPKPLKVLVSDPNNFYKTIGVDPYIFHYPLNMKQVRKKLYEMAETDDFFWKRANELGLKNRGSERPPIDPEKYHAKIIQKYGKNPSSILLYNAIETSDFSTESMARLSRL